MPFKKNTNARLDVDVSKLAVESGVTLPLVSNKAGSWAYYECTIEAMLDSGIVVHRRLPQVNNAPDTLATCDISDPNLAALVGAIGGGIAGAAMQGINLKSKDQYADIVQRMGHSQYWFRLWGRAARLGYQIPIPSIKTIGGVPAIPYDKNPQWAFNRIAPGGNFGGVILWHAEWSLWYTTAVPPTSNAIPAQDPSAHISGSVAPPAGIQVPYSLPDDNAVASTPATTTPGQFISGVKR